MEAYILPTKVTIFFSVQADFIELVTAVLKLKKSRSHSIFMFHILMNNWKADRRTKIHVNKYVR